MIGSDTFFMQTHALDRQAMLLGEARNRHLLNRIRRQQNELGTEPATRRRGYASTSAARALANVRNARSGRPTASARFTPTGARAGSSRAAGGNRQEALRGEQGGSTLR